MQYQVFLNILCLLHCVLLCLQVMYQLSGPVCKATWRYCTSYSASHIDFLSI